MTERIGRQIPTLEVVPKFKDSLSVACHKFNALGDLNLLEWQDYILDGWLGIDKYGRFTAPICGIEVPRQNGKTLGLLVPRITYGMAILGEQVIYTSHQQSTSTETFESVADFFNKPKLKKLVKVIKYALGREEIRLKNGARIQFLARTRKGGRGHHCDLLIYDEALELGAKEQASFSPTMRARKNPQTIYASTPPEPSSDAEVYKLIRKNAIDGKTKKTAWAEWSIKDFPANKTADELIELAYETNPSMGILIEESTIRDDIEQTPIDSFARETLGYFEKDNVVETVISLKDWLNCEKTKTECKKIKGFPAYGVKFAPDGGSYALSIAYGDRQDLVYTECIECNTLENGIQPLVDWLCARADKCTQIIIDGQSNAQLLFEKLMRQGVSKRILIKPKVADAIACFSLFKNDILEQKIAHIKNEYTTDCVCKCGKRLIGKEGFGFASTETEDACVPESMAYAIWATRNTKRHPERVQRIG